MLDKSTPFFANLGLTHLLGFLCLSQFLFILYLLTGQKSETAVKIEERYSVVIPNLQDVPKEAANSTAVISPFLQVTPQLNMMAVPAANISEDFSAPCIIHRTVASLSKFRHMSHNKAGNYYQSWSRMLPPYCYQLMWHNVLYDQLVALLMPEALEDYNWLKTPTERSDFARILIMYHYGGVYADNDVELRRPPEEWTMGEKGVGLVIGLEYSKKKDTVLVNSVAQYVFAAVPRHPLLKEVLNHIVDNIHTERTTGDVYYRNFGALAKVLDRTGPQVLTRVMHKFFSEHGTSFDEIYDSGKPYRAPGTDVLVLPHDAFRPHFLKRMFSSTMVVHHAEGNWKKCKGKGCFKRSSAPMPGKAQEQL